MKNLAARTDFYDYPAGYKQHALPTPYLGGAAVMAGFIVAVLVFGGAWSRFAPAILCALLLSAMGTIDDRKGLGISIRLAVQILAALLLWLSGGGWDLGNPEVAGALTVIWMVGVTNAFNLMDNMDGAAATVGLTSALGVAALAISVGDPRLAILALGLAGACGGFLPHNLVAPARIFLGDGGSLPLGFLIAALVISCPSDSVGWVGLLAVVPLAGLPIFDTGLVVVSRYRRRVTILSGGRDHLTHRIYKWANTPRKVAILLAALQGALCVLALGLRPLSRHELALAAAGYLTLALVALVWLERPLGAQIRRPQGEQPA
jgi:UDP-GlcNAc:undecaprenyl-phosphate GlcNAc-1-phosphate transferase